jgi:hypothetical protein
MFHLILICLSIYFVLSAIVACLTPEVKVTVNCDHQNNTHKDIPDYLFQ